MGEKQFNNTVAGSGGTLATNTTGTVETDNYATGGDFSLSDGDSLNPAAVVQELVVTHVGDPSLTLTLSTTGGSTITVPHEGGTLTLDKLEIDAVEVADADNTGASIKGVWAGE
ncbi:hypothetical protein LPA44_04120 [Halobacterium sp. KA-4]|uniref:hypothetical protein n=1 Tax=Halobacterium sp. KA-4 TaxID=2896367 RepID=UPI001E4CB792|nr:hypothetical protein [Halobacterium sp. KA-4]MCD2199085.1 hypothetical protein [Halobacterium sp. KA-4]